MARGRDVVSAGLDHIAALGDVLDCLTEWDRVLIAIEADPQLLVDIGEAGRAVCVLDGAGRRLMAQLEARLVG